MENQKIKWLKIKYAASHRMRWFDTPDTVFCDEKRVLIALWKISCRVSSWFACCLSFHKIDLFSGTPSVKSLLDNSKVSELGLASFFLLFFFLNLWLWEAVYDIF